MLLDTNTCNVKICIDSKKTKIIITIQKHKKLT